MKAANPSAISINIRIAFETSCICICVLCLNVYRVLHTFLRFISQLIHRENSNTFMVANSLQSSASCQTWVRQRKIPASVTSTVANHD